MASLLNLPYQTDDYLRCAIESIFSAVAPVQSVKAWENEDFPHVTFALACVQEGDLPLVREQLFQAVCFHAEKQPGREIRYLGDRAKSTLCWRTFPYTWRSPKEEQFGVMFRLSWWDESYRNRPAYVNARAFENIKPVS